MYVIIPHYFLKIIAVSLMESALSHFAKHFFLSFECISVWQPWYKELQGIKELIVSVGKRLALGSVCHWSCGNSCSSSASVDLAGKYKDTCYSC